MQSGELEDAEIDRVSVTLQQTGDLFSLLSQGGSNGNKRW